jgi:type IV secretory pathway TraG/TraD family ATPase VirD4
MSATTRRRGPGTPRAELAFVALVLIIVNVLGVLAISIWHPLIGAAVGSGLACLGGCAVWLTVRFDRRRPDIDRAAAHLPGPRQVPGLSTRGAAETAVRLGVHATKPGVYIGRSIRGRQDLWGSWEDMHMDIWGPRTGKTATRAIPAVVAAPGSVVVTSNKRDIVDATRGVRERRGPVWVFDPQSQAAEPPSWWWNPLTFIGDNIVKAHMAASFFSGINRPAHARSDAYFEPAAQGLFGAYLLAASLEGLPITRTLSWLLRTADDTPERILRAHGGHDRAADSIAMVQAAPHEQRAGVFGTAAQIASPLAAPTVMEWVTPGSNPRRPEFRHADFAQRDDSTIYLLSEETNRAAAPFLLILISGLAYALEGRAITSPGGRLPTPAMFVLDEIANICPWHELPLLYSHYGSRGIVMMTILQSWAQGVAVWGEAGMAAMWSAANIRVYGGGVADMKFLHDLSQATPRFEPHTTQVSHSAGAFFNRTVTRGSRSEPVLDASDLARMPRGRALVQVSGAGSVLVQTMPWWQGPHAAEIKDSLAKYAPRPQRAA